MHYIQKKRQKKLEHSIIKMVTNTATEIANGRINNESSSGRY